jgi:aquaporin TIP
VEKFRPWLAEFVGTFALIFVGIGAIKTAVDKRSRTLAGFAIGATITLDILFGGPLTGAAMNPARVFGPALASWFWHDHYVYWIGPLIGGALGGFVYGLLYERKPVAT